MATRSFRPALSSVAVPLAAALLLGACATPGLSGGMAGGQAPMRGPGADYVYGPEAHQGPGGWDGEWNPAWTGVEQPGDLFGGEDVASVDVFIEPLQRYGRWLQTRWGLAFRPDVRPDWRPYVNGRWTEYRLWISDDPWGWATDHYGRWAHDAALGWVWVPGTQWGPHWVAFRENEQMAGWAPIPPGVQYDIGVGFGGGYRGWGFNDWNSWYGPGWVWVPSNVLFQPGLRQHVLPPVWAPIHWQQTRWQHWTPWRPARGWAGAPGRNYWRGSAPVSSRVAGSLARQADFGGAPIARTPGWESNRPVSPGNGRNDWQGRNNWQERGDQAGGSWRNRSPGARPGMVEPASDPRRAPASGGEPTMIDGSRSWQSRPMPSRDQSGTAGSWRSRDTAPMASSRGSGRSDWGNNVGARTGRPVVNATPPSRMNSSMGNRSAPPSAAIRPAASSAADTARAPFPQRAAPERAIPQRTAPQRAAPPQRAESRPSSPPPAIQRGRSSEGSYNEH
jgi:hypothetical protein